MRAGCADLDVIVTGVGPVAAAAAVARALAAASRPVVNLGVAGTLVPGAALLVGTRAVAAGLGAEGPDGEPLTLARLGMGSDAVDADPALLAAARAALPEATAGELLTVWTATGSTRTARALAARHPGAVGEAMEGYGAAVAARDAGAPFLEVRSVSNVVGPRRDWDLAGALDRLTAAAAALAEAGVLR